MQCPGKSTGVFTCVIISCLSADGKNSRSQNHEIPAIRECTPRNLIKELHASMAQLHTVVFLAEWEQSMEDLTG